MTIAEPGMPPPWANPIWPDQLPDPTSLRLLYGSVADELVVLFENARGQAAYVDFIDTPDVTYAGVKVDMHSGAVIGVHVYPLAALAVELHPAWRRALMPDPSPRIANRIVTDIKQLFERYGTGREDDDLD